MAAFWIFLFVLLVAVFLGLVLAFFFLGSPRKEREPLKRAEPDDLQTSSMKPVSRRDELREDVDGAISDYFQDYWAGDMMTEVDTSFFSKDLLYNCGLPSVISEAIWVKIVYFSQSGKLSVPQGFYEKLADLKDEFILRDCSAKLNGRALELEKSGNIDGAVELYEKSIAMEFAQPFPFERLRIIYKRRKDPANELRVLRAGVALFEPANDERFLQALSEYPQLEEEVGNARCNPKKGTLRDENGDLVVAFISEEAKYRYRIQELLKKYPDLE